MDNYERNAHFQDSARQVSYKVLDLIPNSLHTYSRDDQKLVAEIIAQYAYDLVLHGFASVPASLQAELGDPDNCVKAVPDMTEWPKMTSQSPAPDE